MAHIKSVSDAILLVLSDIKCLRALVKIIQNPQATAVADVYAKLREFSKNVTLSAAEQQEFYDSLKDGVMTMNAATLVDYCDSLSGNLKKRGKGSPQEWTP